MSHGKKVTSHPDIGGRICAFLRAQHPIKTSECVAAETGIAEETIAHWLKIDGRPSAAHLLALIGAYEAEFLISIAPGLGKWLDPVRREAKLAELQRKRDLITSEIQALRDETDGGNMGNGMFVDGLRTGGSVAPARLGVARLPEGSAIHRTGVETDTGEET